MRNAFDLAIPIPVCDTPDVDGIDVTSITLVGTFTFVVPYVIYTLKIGWSEEQDGTPDSVTDDFTTQSNGGDPNIMNVDVDVLAILEPSTEYVEGGQAIFIYTGADAGNWLTAVDLTLTVHYANGASMTVEFQDIDDFVGGYAYCPLIADPPTVLDCCYV